VFRGGLAFETLAAAAAHALQSNLQSERLPCACSKAAPVFVPNRIRAYCESDRPLNTPLPPSNLTALLLLNNQRVRGRAVSRECAPSLERGTSVAHPLQASMSAIAMQHPARSGVLPPPDEVTRKLVQQIE